MITKCDINYFALLSVFVTVLRRDCNEKTALSMDIHLLQSQPAKRKQFLLFGPQTSTKPQKKRTLYSRVAYAADCGSRGFCMIIFGQHTKIIGESIRKQKNHVAYFYDGFPMFWGIF